MSVGLLILRLVVGLTLAAHGSQKLFGWFGGGGIRGTAPVMEHLGFRPGHVHAFLAGLGEVGAGLCLALGLFTPLAAAVAVAVMLVAGVRAHRPSGFFVQNGGFEYVLVLGATGLSLAFIGPGTLSLDYGLGLSWSGVPWGLLALAVGVLGAGFHLLTTRRSAPQPVRPA